jgi:hypothetical protein
MTTTERPPLESTDIPTGDDPFTPRPSAPPATAPDDASNDAKPPFLGRRGRPAPRPTPVRDARPAKVEKPAKTDVELKSGVEQLYAFAAVALMPLDPTCATAIANTAGPAANSLVELSKENAAVRKFLGSLTQTSAWGTVIAAHMPIMLVVMGHHFGNKDNRPDADVVQLHDEAPRTVRHTGAAGGGVGKFCPNCKGAIQNGVMHVCPDGA